VEGVRRDADAAGFELSASLAGERPGEEELTTTDTEV
jgi:hypothetical protein